MAKKAAVDAIIARLKANWALSEIIDVNATTQTPADLSPWIRIEFPIASNRQVVLGRGYREDGGFRIVVATALGEGIGKSNDWCEQIATIFRNRKFDGVQCLAPSIREGIDEDMYFIAAVTVPFYFYYTD